MKKLMIAAAVAVLGIAANAASVQWSVSNNGATDKGGVTIPSGTSIYFVLASYQSDIVTAINNGTFSASTTGVLGSKPSENTRGRVTVSPVTSSLLKLDEKGDGVPTDFKILVLDTKTVTGETWYKFSDKVSVATYDETLTTPVPTTAVFGADQWTAGSAWTKAENVPEPTSAMLLLLGVAGLALRRRRA